MLTLILAELFLRWSGTSGPPIVRDDPELGRSLKPNVRYVFVNEGLSMGTINRYGYFGPAYPRTKPDETIRVALLGDSYVAGFQLFDRHHFRSILESSLVSATGRRVEVLNFGFAGFNLERSYVYFSKFVRQFGADYTLFFIGADDFVEKDNIFGPRCIMSHDSLIITDDFRSSRAFQKTWRLRFLRHFGLYSMHKKVLAIFQTGQTAHILFDKFYNKKSVPEHHEEAIPEDRRKILQAIVDELVRINGTITKVIFVIKRPIPEDIQRMICSRGIDCLDPSDQLDDLRAIGVDPFYWQGSQRYGHWNHKAHQVIGNFLSAEISKKR